MPKEQEAKWEVIDGKRYYRLSDGTFAKGKTPMNMAASRQLIQLCKQAETHLIQNGLVYPLYAESSFFAMAQNVSGIVYHTLDGTVRFLKGERLDS